VVRFQPAPYLPLAKMPTASTPKSAADAVHRDGAHRVVDALALLEEHRLDDQHTGDEPITAAAHGSTKAQGR
jgi:hypothetical protein